VRRFTAAIILGRAASERPRGKKRRKELCLDNITHSLFGAAVAEVAQPESASAAERGLFMAGSIIAANLPDIDLIYTGITPAPLGYLLHHRGHTHTIAGLLGLGLILAIALRLSPTARRLTRAHRLRLWGALGLNLIAHVSLDGLNTYGVHPFFPFDARWFYGDAVFIFEPWLWMLLGVAALRNAQRPSWRGLTAVLLAILIVAIGALGVVTVTAAALLAISAVVLGIATKDTSRPVRSAIALAGTAFFVTGMFGISRLARAQVLGAVAEDSRGEIVDVVLSPDPAVPICWTVIVLERNAASGDLISRRGTLSMMPRLHPPSACVSRRFMPGDNGPLSSPGAIAWSDEFHDPVARLRLLYDRDCWVRAWLQFGRAPTLQDGRILDLRFDTGVRSNFSALRIPADPASAGCPAHVTAWGLPRRDVLGVSR
jgi:inner membrane protein